MLARLVRHVFAPSPSRLFPADSMQRIAAAVAAGETLHLGQAGGHLIGAQPDGQPGKKTGHDHGGHDHNHAAGASARSLSIALCLTGSFSDFLFLNSVSF